MKYHFATIVPTVAAKQLIHQTIGIAFGDQGCVVVVNLMRLCQSDLKVKVMVLGGSLLTLVFLLLAIVALMILLGVAYRNDSEDVSPEPDRRLDRLAAILDTDVMEGIIKQARIEGKSEAEILNQLLRRALENQARA